MLDSIVSAFDRFLGRGDAAVTVPPMDGALKPNHLLEAAPPGIAVPAADNLTFCGTRLFVSSGPAILEIDPAGGATKPYRDGETGDVLAMAGTPGGSLAIARAGVGISIEEGRHRGRRFSEVLGTPLRCPMCIAFVDDDRIVVCESSSVHGPHLWQRDLLESQASGSVWLIDLATSEAKRVASGLGFPYGLLVGAQGELIVAESWKSRLLRIPLYGSRAPEVVLSGIPGYPSRLAAGADGRTWMTVFAPRSQLIELVRREKRYRRAMMAEVDPAYWVAPSLGSGGSFHEPMQGGALKQMGILKPWAPTRSYGLVVLLDHNLQPVTGFHSRSGGRRHGITSAAELADGSLLVASKGAGEVIRVDTRARAA